MVLVAAAALLGGARLRAESQSVQLLDVPFLPQSEALCGGAAAAMVMRYWGATGVYAETFADLVDRETDGIRGADLLRALEARGWTARSFRGDRAAAQGHLQAGRPVVALIEDRPGRFHYVVVVAWAGGRVVAHDPARAPFRLYDERGFDAAWSASGRWTMLALPPSPRDRDVPIPAPLGPMPGAGPCDRMVEEAVRLAGAGDTAAAARLLQLGTHACPASSAPWREIAGLHVLREEWPEAANAARRAIALDPGDRHAWRTLATSLYLQDDATAALRAWNQAGEPLVDLVEIAGLDRTRHAIAARLLDIAPGELLTNRRLSGAARRLSEMPAAQTTRVGYRPVGSGRAHLTAVLLERPLAPWSPVLLTAAAVRAATDRDVRVAIANPSGGGEAWTAVWRWWEARPAVHLTLAAPAPFGGVWSVTAATERESYAVAGLPAREARRGAAMSVSNWLDSGVRWEASTGVDDWSGRGASLRLGGGIEYRTPSDRGSSRATLAVWSGTPRVWSASATASWRSSPSHDGGVLLAQGGWDVVSRDAPATLWPGASTGQGRPVLLRAHPLLNDGVIDGGVFGRALAHGTVEWRQWQRPWRLPVRVGLAMFADAARAFDAPAGFDRRGHVDAGVGARIRLAGAGLLRVDVAKGLRDGATVLSVGWMRQ